MSLASKNRKLDLSESLRFQKCLFIYSGLVILPDSGLGFDRGFLVRHIIEIAGPLRRSVRVPCSLQGSNSGKNGVWRLGTEPNRDGS